MMLRRWLAAFLLLLPALSAARAEDNPPKPAWEGTWAGTIGTLPVHVCLYSVGEHAGGAYYYDRHKKLLLLSSETNGRDWTERDGDKSGARWHLDGGKDRLSGAWNDGNRRLVISLHRTKGVIPDYGDVCSDSTFVAPRLVPYEIGRTRSTFAGEPIERLSYSPAFLGKSLEVTTFRLLRTSSGVEKINALLKDIIPTEDGRGDVLDCVLSPAALGGEKGYLNEAVEPALLTRTILSVRETGEAYCGGAHPSGISLLRTYDLVRGVAFDPYSWFIEKAVEVHSFEDGGKLVTYKTFKPEFVAVLARESLGVDDDDCAESIRSESSWEIGVQQSGFVFIPNLPHVVEACKDDVVRTFDELQPWLSDEGKTLVASLKP